MLSLISEMFHHPARRKKTQLSENVCAVVNQCEPRIVMSAHSLAKVAPAAAAPADFSGHWNLQSSFGTGTADITQDPGSTKVTAVIALGPITLNAKGHAKGDQLILKAKGQYQGAPAKGKVTGQLSDPTHFAGTANAKFLGQKHSLPFTATKAEPI